MKVIAAGVNPRRRNVLQELLRYRALLINLVRADLRIKYRDAFLGFLWSLVHPLFTILVFYFAFNVVLDVGLPDYLAFLLVGLLPWNFFAAAVASSTTAVVGNGSLMRKVAFPLEVLPISRVLFHLLQLCLALAVFFPVALLLTHLRPVAPMVLAVPLLTLHVLFTLGIALALAALTTLWRDIAHITEMSLPLLFWLTPIVYPEDRAPALVKAFFQVSPLALFAIAYRDVLVRGQAPGAQTWVALAAWTGLSLVVGQAIFRRYYTRLVEEV